MITFETPLKELKHLALREVASFKKEGKLTKRALEEIPYSIIKGDIPKYRCCVYKERAIFYQRLKLASGYLPEGEIVDDLVKLKSKDQIIYVIPSACEKCSINKFEVTGACRGCIQHKCMEVCPVNAIIRVNGRSYINHELCKECGMCKKACPYNAIVEVMRPCKKVCPTGAMKFGEDQKAVIDESKCINCGLCMQVCPFGAVSDTSSIAQVTEEIMNEKNLYAVVAPAIAGQFGPKVNVGQVKNAFIKLGFSDMIEAACGADAVTVHESEEFINRIENGSKYMTTSCCPGFTGYIEKKFPNEVDKISSTVSPMVATAKLIKSKKEDAVVVFVGPCTAKKAEVLKGEAKEAVDYVLTFEEICALFAAFEIDPENCEESTVEDASVYGRRFAQGGGVTAAIDNFIKVKGSSVDFKPIKVSGGDDIKKTMVMAKTDNLNANFIEGMLCEGGCIGGPATINNLKKVKGQLNKFSKESKIKNVTDNKNLKDFEKINIEE